MTPSTSPTSSGSRAEVTSSNSMSLGSMATARAMATRCCWPPESWSGSAVRRLSPGPRGRASARRSPCASALSLPLHLGEAEHDVLERGHVREEVELLEDHADRGALGRDRALAAGDDARRRPCGSRSARRRRRSRPPRYSSSRLTQRRKVVLPEPEAPMRATTSPCSTSMSMPLRTSVLAEALVDVAGVEERLGHGPQYLKWAKRRSSRDPSWAMVKLRMK